jgi:hypothetical protein
MFNCRLFLAVSAAVFIATAFAVPVAGQQVLYNNGPDGDIGYYRVNFGAAVSNSFTLSKGASLSGVTLTIYCVNDENQPMRVKWAITTEPFGGDVKAEGFANMTELGDTYPTRFHFFAWPMGFALPNVALPAGTYYLQVQDVITHWYTFAFWAQTGDGDSAAYYEPIAQNGYGGISPVPSEVFAIVGEWSARE